LFSLTFYTPLALSGYTRNLTHKPWIVDIFSSLVIQELSEFSQELDVLRQVDRVDVIKVVISVSGFSSLDGFVF
jgi:hypothetical protein